MIAIAILVCQNVYGTTKNFVINQANNIAGIIDMENNNIKDNTNTTNTVATANNIFNISHQPLYTFKELRLRRFACCFFTIISPQISNFS